MTITDAQRAMLAVFAAREAGPRGSLEQMRAIALCIRQRVRGGWEGGSWMAVMESAPDHAAHERFAEGYRLDPNDRSLQRMLGDVDDIYYAQRGLAMAQADAGMTMEQSIVENDCKYWCFLNRPMTEWFRENIAKDLQNHPSVGQMGLMMFYK